MIFLTVEEDAIQVSQLDSKELLGYAKTHAELVALLDHFKINKNTTFICSSSLDFPKDYTNDGEVITLCNTIRGSK